MKKILFSLICLLGVLSLSAQTEPDVYKFLHNDINGTARYVGMAGAFGALGGDISAVKDNPAGLGVYRQSEFVTTLNYHIQNSNAVWNGQKASDEMYRLNFNNLSFVLSSKTWANQNEIYTGLQNSNWIFSYNRLKSFNRNLTIKGNESLSSITDFLADFSYGLSKDQISDLPFDDIDVPWLSILAYESYLINPDEDDQKLWHPVLGNGEKVKPSYNSTVRGHLDEYSFGWSGNFSNRIFLGATLNLRTVNYSVKSTYAETLGFGGNLYLKNNMQTTGSGVNFNIGTIILPTNYLRLSLALQTPTIYSLYDLYNGNMYGEIIYDDGSDVGNVTTDYADLYYKLKDPLKINAGVAYIFGKKGLISAEYNFSDYGRTKIKDETGNSNMFDAENEGMKDMLEKVHTIKLGLEFKPAEQFAIRAGYAHMTAGTNDNTQKWLRLNTTRTDPEFFRYTGTNYFTAGFGYRQSFWYLDFALMHKREGMEFEPYNSSNLGNDFKANPATISVNNTNVLATLGFRF